MCICIHLSTHISPVRHSCGQSYIALLYDLVLKTHYQYEVRPQQIYLFEEGNIQIVMIELKIVQKNHVSSNSAFLFTYCFLSIA